MPLDTYIHFEKPGDVGAPLVFTFHGTGGDEHQFPGLVEQILPRASIVSPRGDVSEHGANRFFRRTGEGVYDMDDLAARTETMADFMRAHTAQRPDRPVYAMGYSNGANILAAVLFRYPELVSRTALLHPLIPWAPAPNPRLNGRSILVSAGMADPICPWPQTKSLLQYFERQKAALDVVTHPGGHEVRQEELLRLRDFLTRETSQAA
jgi:phospholipase/carboxylesterase